VSEKKKQQLHRATKLFSRFGRLWQELRLVGGARLRYAPLILALILLSSALDLVGVALIAPFIGLLLGDDSLLGWLPVFLREVLGADPIGGLSVLLICLFVGKAVAAILVQWSITRLTESIRASLIARLLSSYQSRSYLWYLRQNSSDLVNRFTWYTTAFSSNFLGSGLRLIADLMVFLALGLLIFAVNWVAFAMLFGVLAVVFLAVPAYVKNRASRLMRTIATANGQLVRSVQQALGGLREIRVIGCEDYFRDRAVESTAHLVSAGSRYQVLTLLPRHAVEIAMVVFLVALVAFTRANAEVGAALLPLLGVIGASAVRLMPASTSLLSNFNSLRANRFVVALLAEDLSAEPSGVASAPAERQHAGIDGPFRSLELHEVGFSYDGGDRYVLRDIDFRVDAGDTIGVMGPSGAGKSTLADLMLALLSPTTGGIRVNGLPLDEVRRAWQARVAYIPQAPYLLDDTLRRNVALGVPDDQIDESRLREALRGASLETFVDGLPNGLDTELGERGVRVSGGQRQRVSIARALYHDREFIVLDEATSALDNETESEILDTIANLRGRKTMVIIAHRESTLVTCTRRIVLTPRLQGAVLRQEIAG
jgi:ABC-type multidrug transport system fused ATPase/permease subunit